jgi:hypothetical protein
MSEAIVPSLLAASAPFCVGVEPLVSSGELKMVCANPKTPLLIYQAGGDASGEYFPVNLTTNT